MASEDLETTTAPADAGRAYRTERVTFPGGGAELVGHLFVPDGPPPDGGYAALVLAGPWTQVKEQTADIYGARLAGRGFAALSLDFRYWGESGGEPRFFESQDKIGDLGSAVSFLAGRPDVDAGRIGAYGICFGAGYVLAAAVRDERIRAVVTTAAWIHDRPSLAAMFGEEEIERRLRVGAEAGERWRGDGVLQTVPAWEDGNPEAGMSFPGGYYSTPERGAIPEWPNQLAVLSWPDWVDLDAVALAPEVRVPTLFVHSDGSALPDNVRKAHADLGGPAHLFWTKGDHFDFYDREPQVSLSADVAAAFLRTVL